MRPVRHGATGTEVRIGRHEIVVGSASPTKSQKARDQPAMARTAAAASAALSARSTSPRPNFSRLVLS
jgi:hypothetical protein